MASLPVRREALSGRWDPLREVEDLRERVDRLFETVMSPTSLTGLAWSPPVDLEETDDA
jgi:HSP20 family protein